MTDALKKSPEGGENSSRVVQDVVGIICVSLALLVACALFSYSPADGGINAQLATDVTNWVGIGGALIADILFTVLGLLALVVPISLVGTGWALLGHRPLAHYKYRIAGLSCLLLSLTLLLSSLQFFQPWLPFPVGGLMGVWMNTVFSYCFSVLGARIVGMALLFSGIVLLTENSLKDYTIRGIEWLKVKLNSFRSFQKSKPIIANAAVNEVAKEKPFVVFSKPVVSPTVPPPMSLLEVHPSQVQIVERDTSQAKKLVEEAEKERQARVKQYELPPLQLLDYDAPPPIALDENFMRAQALRLEQTFGQFGIEGHVREIRPGPVVTMYEFVPSPGIKLSRIAALSDDIAMAMEAIHVRIVAPIPGKGAVGIEVPNENREMVYLKEIVADPNYRKFPHKLCMAVGKNIEGKSYYLNLADMPHLLMAGTTGSGKSVSMNAMICSILYRATPDEVRFLMIDPKMLELSIYEGIPHLLLPPIIDSKKAALALRWAVREMEQRYLLMNELGVRDINGYNERIAAAKKGEGELPVRSEPQQHGHLPYIVVVVDEYADLVAVGGKDVEALVMRLAQKARAAGVHVMLATQRPSVDVITGVIKANFPVRIGFRLASAIDSKTIINRHGAEKLLGRGDALIMPPGTSDCTRVHGAFISEKELVRVVDFWKTQSEPEYNMDILTAEEGQGNSLFPEEGNTQDERYPEAVEIVLRTGKCSSSWLQRQMGVGYNRAARMVERMEAEGVVGPILNARGDREILGRK